MMSLQIINNKMYTAVFNIGYETESSSGVLNRTPIIYQFNSVKEYTDFIRGGMVNIVDWAIKNYVPKSSIVLYTNISRLYMEGDEEWVWSNDFNIKCKNIREYKPLINLSDEEIEALLRDEVINNVLNG